MRKYGELDSKGQVILNPKLHFIADGAERIIDGATNMLYKPYGYVSNSIVGSAFRILTGDPLYIDVKNNPRRRAKYYLDHLKRGGYFWNEVQSSVSKGFIKRKDAIEALKSYLEIFKCRYEREILEASSFPPARRAAFERFHKSSRERYIYDAQETLSQINRNDEKITYNGLSI